MITLHFDGSCLPTNPGHHGGIGVVIKNGEFSHKISKEFDSEKLISNNVTEYAALIEGLEYLLANGLENEKIDVFGDSALVIRQCKGTYKVGEGMYRENAIKCQFLLRNFKNISFTWIPREQNGEADELSNKSKTKMKKCAKKQLSLMIENSRLSKEYQQATR